TYLYTYTSIMSNNRSKAKIEQEEDEPRLTLPHQGVLFAIYDEFDSDESSQQDEATIYYYPEEKDQERKALYGGVLLAFMGTLIDFFNSKSQIDYMVLERHTIAYKIVGPYTMGLTASNLIPPSTIKAHLDHLYNMFCFHFRSFQDVKSKENKIRMERILNRMMPKFSTELYQNRMRSFMPIPYTPLPSGSNKTFFKASDLIHNIIFPEHLGGALFIKNHVLYTNIELDTTRHILDLINREREENNSNRTYPYSGIWDVDTLTVYISPAHYNKLATYKRDYTNLNVPLVPDAPPQAAQQQQQQQQQQDDHEHVKEKQPEPSANFVPVELLLVFWPQVTVAVLTNELGHQANRYLNKIMARPISSVVESLEKDTFNQTGLTSNTTISPSAFQYHFLSHNTLTEQAVSSGMSTEIEDIFIHTCSNIHDTFNENPNITQMFLRNQQSEIFCKKQFGHEIYYQPKNSNQFVEQCETIVQKNLRENHNINIL
ncbi:hypothetical protein SAMD00019534_099040, partial [Acytostelium subglobosum LB1]|uniref:hypothetical protein n=1 Tax=Acytostelium subglobosum LB1 TaxID=1410327 RepID=UPI000644E7FE